MTRPDKSTSVKADKVDPTPQYSYLKDWTPEYAAAAEFELVVQNKMLPVHKHVMSMSPVFQRELFKTESKKSVLNASLNNKKSGPVETKLKLSSPLFMETTVDEMCLLLCHVYATDATLSTERMDEVRKLFSLTEEFGFPAITRRCVNFVRNSESLAAGLTDDIEENGAGAASEWLELAVKWDFNLIKNEICGYVGENFLEIYGRDQETQEPDKQYADLVMLLESEPELWKRVARRQAERIEAGPSLASLISDEPSTTLIYGILIGIFAGSILPSWMFFLLLCWTVWYVYNRMPPAVMVVIKTTLQGAMHGILHGEAKPEETTKKIETKETATFKNKGKPPVLRRANHVTA